MPTACAASRSSSLRSRSCSTLRSEPRSLARPSVMYAGRPTAARPSPIGATVRPVNPNGRVSTGPAYARQGGFGGPKDTPRVVSGRTRCPSPSTVAASAEAGAAHAVRLPPVRPSSPACSRSPGSPGAGRDHDDLPAENDLVDVDRRDEVDGLAFELVHAGRLGADAEPAAGPGLPSRLPARTPPAEAIPPAVSASPPASLKPMVPVPSSRPGPTGVPAVLDMSVAIEASSLVAVRCSGHLRRGRARARVRAKPSWGRAWQRAGRAGGGSQRPRRRSSRRRSPRRGFTLRRRSQNGYLRPPSRPALGVQSPAVLRAARTTRSRLARS